MRLLNIGIVGCGFAGAATAALLGRAGHQVTVYEEFDEPAAVGLASFCSPRGCLQPALFRTEMLRTMSGIKRGIVRPSLELKPISSALPSHPG